MRTLGAMRSSRVFRLRKRWYALLLVLVVLGLFARSEWLFKWMYPIHYEELIRSEAEKHQVDPYLVAAIVQVESRYDPARRSSKGAVGLMQIMPDTARWAAEVKKMRIDAVAYLHDPAVNLDIGSWYISSLIREFDGNHTAAIAAYNGGPGNVRQWLASGVWDGTLDGAKAIPFGETRHFVQRVYYFWDKYHRVYGPPQ
ncbi:lytic transglycosylase domain-containing protein [Paenibacillus thermoaerophilus]